MMESPVIPLTILIIILGTVLAVISKRKGNVVPSTNGSRPTATSNEPETRVSKIREKVSNFFRLSNVLKLIGIFVVVMFIIGMVSAPFRDKPAPIEDGPSHTLPELRAGETYTKAQFCRGYGRIHQVQFLDKRFDFQNTDVLIVVPGTGGNNAEFRYDGENLFDVSGSNTGYTLNNLPDGNCFMIKIGDGGKRLVPSGAIRVTSTLNDYEKERQAEHAL